MVAGVELVVGVGCDPVVGWGCVALGEKMSFTVWGLTTPYDGPIALYTSKELALQEADRYNASVGRASSYVDVSSFEVFDAPDPDLVG